MQSGLTGRFDIADWNPRYNEHTDGASDIADATDGILSHFDFAGSVRYVGAEVAVAVLAAQASSTYVFTPHADIGATYTIEFEVRIATADGVVLLPNAMGSTEARLRLEAYSPAYPAIEIYVTRAGLVVSALNGRYPTLVPGTAFVDGDVTVRVVIDHNTGFVSVLLGGIPAYSRDIGDSWLVAPNLRKAGSIRINADWPRADFNGFGIRGIPGEGDVILGFTALRLSSAALYQTAKPVAKIVTKTVAVVGTVVNVYGSRSESVSGLPLGYEWTLASKPLGSNPVAGGGDFPTASLPLGSDFGVFRFKERDITGNGWTVQIRKNSANAPLLLTVNNRLRRLVIRAATDSDGAVTTTADSLRAVLTDPTAFEHNADFSAIVEFVYGATLGSELLVPGTATFVGGALSNLADFTLVLDTPGVYILELRVSENGVWSDAIQHVLTAQLSEQLIGGVGDTSFLFKYMRDFWRSVEDTDKIEALWSGASRMISASVAELWQLDLAKSISTVTPLFQRHWMPIITGISQDELLDPVLVHQERFDEVGTPLANPLGVIARSSVTSRLRGEIGDIVLLRSDVGAPVLARVAKSDGTLTVFDGAPVIAAVDVAAPGLFRQEADETFFSASDAFSTVSDVTSLYIRTTRPSAGLIEVVDLAVIAGDTRYFNVGTTPTLEADGSLYGTATRLSEAVRVTRQTFFSVKFDADVVPPSLGDVALIRVFDSETAEVVTIGVPVLAYNVELAALYVDWDLAEKVYKAVLGQAGVEANSLLSLDIKLEGIRYTSELLSDTANVKSIPQLGSTDGRAVLVENRDYATHDSRLKVLDSVSGTTSGTSAVLTINNAVYGPWVDRTSSSKISARSAVLSTGLDAGVHVVVSATPGRVELAAAVRTIDTPVKLPVYDSDVFPPATFWAPVMYVDNQLVEDNFGTLLGLTRQDVLDTFRARTSYLDVLRGVWAAVMRGPHIGNITSAVNTLLGAPYSLSGGHIVEILESPAPGVPGRIVIIGRDGDTYTHSIPPGARLGINPATNRVIKASREDAVRDDDWYDGELPAFSTLVEFAEVDDIYTDEGAVLSGLSLGVDTPAKYHTFVIRAPLVDVDDTSIFGLLNYFVNKARPRYTNVVVLGYVGLHEDLALTTETYLTPAVTNVDTVHVYKGHPAAVDDAFSAAEVYPADDVAYPLDDTLNRGDTWSAADAVERFHGGIRTGLLDSYSGDGSANRSKRVVDPPSRFVDEVDVTESLMFVPCVFQDVGDTEMEVGEFVDIRVGAEEIADHPWNKTRPYVYHVGCGMHPRLPFNIQTPQVRQPKSYIVLAFDKTDPEHGVCGGNSARLDPFVDVDDIGDVTLVGLSSGAVAVPTAKVTLESTPGYYRVRHIAEADKALDLCPETVLTTLLTVYIPNGGMTYEDLLVPSNSIVADRMNGERAQLRPQSLPWSALGAPGELVPVPAKALHASPLNKDLDDLVVFGIDVSFDNADESAQFTYGLFSATADLPLENVHIGAAVTNEAWFDDYAGLPDSNVLRHVVSDVVRQGGTVRVLGVGFIDNDLALEGLPDDVDYTGGTGCSWVYYAQGTAEFAATSTQFVSDKELSAPVPGNLSGYVDVVVKTIRPYRLTDGGEAKTYVDSFVVERALFIEPELFPNNSQGAGASIAGAESAGG